MNIMLISKYGKGHINQYYFREDTAFILIRKVP